MYFIKIYFQNHVCWGNWVGEGERWIKAYPVIGEDSGDGCGFHVCTGFSVPSFDA